MERKKRSPAVDLRSAPPFLCPESFQVHQLASKHPIINEWTDQKLIQLLHLHSFLVRHNSDQFCGELLDLVLLLARMFLQHRVLLKQPKIPGEYFNCVFSSSPISSPFFSHFGWDWTVERSYWPVLQLFSGQLINQPTLLKQGSVRFGRQVNLQALILGLLTNSQGASPILSPRLFCWDHVCVPSHLRIELKISF